MQFFATSLQDLIITLFHAFLGVYHQIKSQKTEKKHYNYKNSISLVCPSVFELFLISSCNLSENDHAVFEECYYDRLQNFDLLQIISQGNS